MKPVYPFQLGWSWGYNKVPWHGQKYTKISTKISLSDIRYQDIAIIWNNYNTWWNHEFFIHTDFPCQLIHILLGWLQFFSCKSLPGMSYHRDIHINLSGRNSMELNLDWIPLDINLQGSFKNEYKQFIFQLILNQCCLMGTTACCLYGWFCCFYEWPLLI